MSNNKSHLLDRKTGRHYIGAPQKPFVNRVESKEEDLQFIRQVTGGKNDDEVIKQFRFILQHFRTNSDLLLRVSKRVGLERDAAVKKLSFYSQKYPDLLELEELFGRKRW